DWNAQGPCWGYVMKVTLCHMQPSHVSHPLASLGEMVGGRFVRAHLLGGDNQVEGDTQVTPRASQEVVIDVRQNAQAIPCSDEALQCRVGVGKREPAGEAICQKPSALAAQWPSQAFSCPLCRLRQDVTIGTVGRRFDTG